MQSSTFPGISRPGLIFIVHVLPTEMMGRDTDRNGRRSWVLRPGFISIRVRNHSPSLRLRLPDTLNAMRGRKCSGLKKWLIHVFPETCVPLRNGRGHSADRDQRQLPLPRDECVTWFFYQWSSDGTKAFRRTTVFRKGAHYIRHGIQ